MVEEDLEILQCTPQAFVEKADQEKATTEGMTMKLPAGFLVRDLDWGCHKFLCS